ncbi:MAG: hypothetical protein CL927_13230 [Deltaproteobacteria bacterium]|nr:hypothetical protein [Deltaproteobacteria bacterium]HCH63448.1 hypothetical protein [Deltaproteobacteria bacterium]
MALNPSNRSLLATLALCASTALMACEQMEPSGNPLVAVSVQTGASAGEGASQVDTRFSDADPFEISSEDLNSKSSDSASGATPATKVGAAAAPAAPVVPATTTAAPAAQPQPVAQASAQAVAMSTAATTEWPIRLVRTHLDEQPPSAILALPDGRRIVVSPGDMVPERGLVVMGIGRERVQLAAIRSNGDHATVAPMELSAQY